MDNLKDTTRPIKEVELRQLAKCRSCGHGIGHQGSPFFYAASIEQVVLDLEAMQRHEGLRMQLGGSAELARIMGPDPTMAHAIPMGTATLCSACAIDRQTPFARLLSED